MRFLPIIIPIALLVSFSVPVLANAETSCTVLSNGVTLSGILVNGNCSVVKDNGAYCFSSAECKSGYCEGATETCQAKTGATTGGTTLINPLKAGTSLETFLGDILKFVIRIGTVVVILMLVFVGYKFVAAQGAPTAIEEAKKMLLWTVVGALILLGAQVISSAIQATVRALGG